jgi:putative membrane protein
MKIRSQTMLAVAVSAVLTISAHAQAGAPTSVASTFVEKAAQGGIAEVELSQLAASNSTNAAVKDFAAQMVTAHTANNAKLASIAQKEGISVPAETDADHVTLRNRLSMSKGADFDRIYVQAMRRDHQTMLHLLDGSQNIQDPDLKSFIEETKPVVEHHLKMANELTGG